MVTEFIGAALPWIAMGLLLAVFFARGARRKKGKREEYGSEGRAAGHLLPLRLSSALHVDVGLGMIAGMILGLLIGSCIDKEHKR